MHSTFVITSVRSMGLYRMNIVIIVMNEVRSYGTIFFDYVKIL